MDVTVALQQVQQMREAGTLLDDRSGLLVGLLGRLEHRGQLDVLLGGLPDADAVAERVEQFLLFDDPVARSDQELIELALAHLGEMIRHARESGLAPVAEAVEALRDGSITVTSTPPRPTGLRLRAGSSSDEPTQMPAGSLVTLDQMRAVAAYDFERLGEVFTPRGNPWAEIADAFFTVTDEDDVWGVGAWLLEPALSWGFGLEPFYRIWEAGASIWLTSTGVEVVRSGRYRRESSYSADSGPAVDPAAQDAAWLEANSTNGARVLQLVADATERGGRRIEFDGLPMTSLPPSFFESSAWRIVQIHGCPGVSGLEALAQLPGLKRLAVSRCEIATAPAAWPPVLEVLGLSNNRLTAWPANLEGLPKLEALWLQDNQLTELPDAVGDLTGLEQLDVSNNRLRSVSPAVGGLTGLQQLFLGGNHELASLPVEILQLPDSCAISLTRTALPEAIQKAKTIRVLRQVW